MERITTHRVREAIAIDLDAIADEMMVDPADIDIIDIEEDDPEGRVIIRVEGCPAYVARMSDHHADARLSLSDEDAEVYELRHYTTDALRAMANDVAEWMDGDVENGPRMVTEQDANELADITDELARRRANA